MKVLRFRPLGVKNGRRHYRVKIEMGDGTRHRLLLSDEHLGSAFAFNRACRERLGKDVLSPSTSTAELHAHLSHALVRAGPGRTPAGFAADPGPEVRRLVSTLFGQLKDLMQSGSGDPDELEDVLSTALEQLSALDD
jgi:hypothetical protein